MSTSDSIQNRNTLNNLLLLAIMCVMAAGWITFSFLHGADAASIISQERPNFIGTARIKQHRAGANGDLVEGEEHLLKAIIKWDAIPNAERYEICHHCNDYIDEETGVADDNVTDEDSIKDIYDIEIGGKNTCGGQPCLVMPGVPKGNNQYHLRVKIDGEWSLWSKHQNFFVSEPGTFEHVEL